MQEPNGLSNPPAGMLIEKWTDEPDTVPESDPRPLRPVLVSVIVAVPENDESVAGPRHAPLRFTAPGEGVVGAGAVGAGPDPPPPPQRADSSAAKASVRSPPMSR